MSAVSSLPQNPLLTQDPVETAAQLESKAFKYEVLSKISYVAIAAIFTTVLIVSQVLGIVTGTLPLINLGLSLSVIPLAWAATHFKHLSENYKRSAATEAKIAVKLSDPAVNGNLLEARFQYFLETATTSRQEITTTLAANPGIAEVDFRLANVYTAGEKEIIITYPSLLNAKLMLEIKQTPTLPFTCLSEIGECQSISLAHRIADEKYAPDATHPYFVFHDGRAPITYEMLSQIQDPAALPDLAPQQA